MVNVVSATQLPCFIIPDEVGGLCICSLHVLVCVQGDSKNGGQIGMKFSA